MKRWERAGGPVGVGSLGWGLVENFIQPRAQEIEKPFLKRALIPVKT